MKYWCEEQTLTSLVNAYFNFALPSDGIVLQLIILTKHGNPSSSLYVLWISKTCTLNFWTFKLLLSTCNCFPHSDFRQIVDTRTRHVYPRCRGWYTAAHVEGDPIDSTIRKIVDGCFCRPENTTPPGGTPSGSAAAMGCPRSIRSPLEPRDSQLSNTKNSEERDRKTVER